jgi:CxxC motif-containing protein
MSSFVCIVCPKGCTLNVTREGEEITVRGNNCKRGEAFAISEVTDPKRTICSTVRTVFEDVPVLPVRVSADIPKGRIFDVMREINKVVVRTRVGRGEAIIKNVLGLDADVISTSDILKMTEYSQYADKNTV